MSADWFQRAIVTGVQKLVLLSLPWTPSEETIQGTAMVWVESLRPARAWQQARDEARIREGFRALSLSVREWPAPSALLLALPRIEPPRALPRPEPTPAQQAKLRQQIREAMQACRAPLPATESDRRAEIDRAWQELQQRVRG